MARTARLEALAAVGLAPGRALAVNETLGPRRRLTADGRTKRAMRRFGYVLHQNELVSGRIDLIARVEQRQPAVFCAQRVELPLGIVLNHNGEDVAGARLMAIHLVDLYSDSRSGFDGCETNGKNNGRKQDGKPPFLYRGKHSCGLILGRLENTTTALGTLLIDRLAVCVFVRSARDARG